MSLEGQQSPASSTSLIEGAAARFGTLVAAVWLLFLVEPLSHHWHERDQPATILGYASALAFAVTYVATFEALRRRRARLQLEMPVSTAWGLLGLLVLFAFGMMAGLDQHSSGAIIFIAVTAAMVLPTRHAAPFVVLLAVVAAVGSYLVPFWEPDVEFPLLALVAGFVMWAVRQVMMRNVELVRTREENEALVLEQERNRFARDLHDILGHSLTVIAVKAELARRLLEVGDGRAANELADVERLSRDALADVRRAVQGYREITLPGELARARGVLAAAGIRADLPSSADDVAGEWRELFAWTIREAVTNIVRHSEARTAEIALTSTSLRITNDGVPAAGNGLVDGTYDGGVGHSSDGSGLVGLRERVQALGGKLQVHRTGPQFTIEVSGR